MLHLKMMPETEMRDNGPMKNSESGLTMKTIGVLGGIGPQATIDFERRIHEAAQRILPQRANGGYPPLVTLFMRHPPVLVDAAWRPLSPLQIDPRVLDAAAQLGKIADLLVVPSNTPHLFRSELEAASGCPMLSIIDVTVAELKRRAVDEVGLLGLGLPQIYVERLEAEGIRFLPTAPSRRDRLDQAILSLMEGREQTADRDAARDAVAELRAAGAVCTILGCTEIPLLLGTDAEAEDLVNPGALLANAVVEAAVDPAG